MQNVDASTNVDDVECCDMPHAIEGGEICGPYKVPRVWPIVKWFIFVCPPVL